METKLKKVPFILACGFYDYEANLPEHDSGDWIDYHRDEYTQHTQDHILPLIKGLAMMYFDKDVVVNFEPDNFDDFGREGYPYEFQICGSCPTDQNIYQINLWFKSSKERDETAESIKRSIS